MNIDPTTTKYLIKSTITADGVVEKPDVVGAIFGQTEGLLGEELDLRDLQKGGRIGRIEVEISSKKGRSEGTVLVPSSLDQVETSILASALETIDRVGPCKANMKIDTIEDVRIVKRKKIVDRARELLSKMIEENKEIGIDLTTSVRESVQMEEITNVGKERLPAGPNIDHSDALIVVEGRNDVLNLLKAGIRNVIAVEGTNIPQTVKDFSSEKVMTAFVDGDRGGELILRELLQVAEIDYVAQAPKGKEVEELTSKQIMKALRHKIPAEQFMETHNFEGLTSSTNDKVKNHQKSRDKKNGNDKGKSKRSDSGGKKSSSSSGKNLSGSQKKQYDILKSIMKSGKAVLLDKNDNEIKKIPVKELAQTVQNEDKVEKIVFDGIITQRLVDIASERGIKSILATKMGNIPKKPSRMELWTKEDFE